MGSHKLKTFDQCVILFREKVQENVEINVRKFKVINVYNAMHRLYNSKQNIVIQKQAVNRISKYIVLNAYFLIFSSNLRCRSLILYELFFCSHFFYTFIHLVNGHLCHICLRIILVNINFNKLYFCFYVQYVQ